MSDKPKYPLVVTANDNTNHAARWRDDGDVYHAATACGKVGQKVLYDGEAVTCATCQATLTTPAGAPAADFCPRCGGTGEEDSGGFWPWGEPVMLPCAECKDKPAPAAGAATPGDTHLCQQCGHKLSCFFCETLRLARAALAQGGGKAGE